jgi:hypothetical protein
MRYVIAMLVAIPVALAATMYLSSPIATWFTALFTYDDPDTVADVHALAFMVSNVGALAVGWTIGWWLGGAIFGRRRDA